MTSRERITNTIEGKRIDRVAVAPFVGSNAVKEWKRDANADLIEGTIEFCDAFGFDLILRNFNIRHDDFAISTPEWKIENSEVLDGENTEITTLIITPEGTFTQKKVVTKLTDYLEVYSIKEHFIKTEADFYLFEKYQPAPKAPDLSALRKVKKLMGDKGIMAPWCNSVFNYMSELRNLQDLLIDPYLNRGFYEDFANYVKNRMKQALKPVLDEGIDMLSYTANVASSKMVGPSYFRENVLPYEKQLVDWIQKQCLGVIYHNCGDGAALIPCYNDLAPCCYESMTEPPYADNSLAECFDKFDKEITLMGNIDQISFLKKASAGEVKKRAGEIISLAAKAGRKFILGTSDFLEENTPYENLKALAQAGKSEH